MINHPALRAPLRRRGIKFPSSGGAGVVIHFGGVGVVFGGVGVVEVVQMMKTANLWQGMI